MFKDKINKLVENATGFDVPQLGGKHKMSRKEVLEALKFQKIWFEDFANDCICTIDKIIVDNFTIDERLD
ncbi:MAG: hypothetical protein PHF86_11250 [Candidatus Nanoarchaeia archaeon]|nr:hypothetical protein [Candidatus Nanoarchaeia archaeon]